jgi:hypothetical protein
MRPNTSESGIFSTNRSRPVSTSILTRILVPNPKNAFQSPGVHSAGLKPDFSAAMLVLIVMLPLPDCLKSPLSLPQEPRPSR